MNTYSSYSMTVDGKSVTTDRTLAVLNPATEQVFGYAPDASAIELDGAVTAARRAFPGWRDTPLSKRRELIFKFGERLIQEISSLKYVLIQEMGKPLADAEFEIGAAGFWAQGVSTLEFPSTVNEDNDTRKSITRHVPIGVVGAIAPWNYPILLAVCKLAPALLAGNTVVLKPSPFTPLSTLKFGEIARDIFPAGVLNVISGGDALGPLMTAHPGIDKVTFTGSTATGKKVMANAASSLKRLTLELGGNDAAIVLPDVNIDVVAGELFWSAFRNSGQLCIATKRLYIHDDIYEPLSRALVQIAKGVKVSDGLEAGSQLGPIQNRPQYQRVVDLINDARSSGLKFLTGGEINSDQKGYFVPVSIVDNPPDNARVVTEEAFGPVLPLLRFHDIDDVIRRANASPYGLAGSVWSSDIDAAQRIAEQLETGTVWINECQYMMPNTAFCGHKQSGFGVENGIEGLLEFTLPQTLVTKKVAGIAPAP